MKCVMAARLFAAAGVFAAGMAGAAPVAPGRAMYLVALGDPPLAAHAAARVHAAGTSGGDDRRALRRELTSADAGAYLRQLDAARTSVLGVAAQRLGRVLAPRQVYRHAANGMALELSDDEAQRFAALPGVVAVRPERVLHVHTDAGPQWIGADALWNGQAGAGIAATRGEGIVIGMIDTGINPSHPSFAALGGDGYTVTNPRGHFYGLCTTGQAQCNAKLIGIYDFTSEGTLGVDSTGHGSHTSGIAAGNVSNNALHGYTASLTRTVSGVAPHANLIMYKGCNAKPVDSTDPGTCAESALVAAIDQATADQVDVINYSIGGSAIDPYELLADPTSDGYAMFQARSAGIVIAVSAGNDGPGAATLDEPGNVPWVIGVANASHNRRFVNSLGAFSGAPNAPPTLSGQGYTSGYGPASIVYAGDYGNALCGVGDTQGTTPTGASNPFPAGTFHGEIVVCDRGTYARVEKGYNVKAGGAGGYILANTASDGESIVSDNHYLPAVHLGYSEGQALKAWIASGATHSGTIAGVSAGLDAAYGDILDASSSRGPYGFSGGVLKPDLTAPGDNILSAARTGNGLALLSGTSMASPHVAGAAALVIGVHPDWTPAQVESALIGTALAGVRNPDGTTPASPLAAGSGRVQPAAAARAGLYLPLNTADFFAGSGSAANPAAHGDLARLNRVGLESENCFQQCSFTRVVRDMSGGGSWQATSSGTPGAVFTVTPSQFTLAAGAAQTLQIKVDVSEAHLPGTWVDGRIVLHKTGGAAATDIALHAAVYSDPGAAPPFQQLSVDSPGGSTSFAIEGLVGLPQAAFTTTSLAPAVHSNVSPGFDSKPGSLYTFPGSGGQFLLFHNVYNLGVDTLSVGRAFIVEIASSDAPRTDLYAGIDSNGNGQPDADEQACHSATLAGSGTVARCVVDLRGAGAVNLWTMVDVPQGTAGISYAVSLSSGIPTIDLVVPGGRTGQQLHVTGPGHVPAAARFPLRVFWGPASADDPAPPLGYGTYYGAVLIDGARDIAPTALGQAGVVPLSITRSEGGDDVADALFPGVTRSYRLSAPQTTLQHVFIDVPPGVTTLAIDSALAPGAPGPVAFAALRSDFPPSTRAAAIAAAPNGAPAATWTIDAATTSRRTTLPVTAGRWYITAQYSGSVDSAVSIGAQGANASAAPTLSPGNYFNPQRSGHGIFLSQANGQQVIDWYTFEEDGTPTWYVAQNTAPVAGAGTWSSTLYRASWDGSGGAPTPIGDVVLTTTAQDAALFSWRLYGQTGSEAFQLLAAPACVPVNGAANLDGNWYPPAQGGYGFDALALPGQQFDALYIYDDTGNPRWLVGGVAPFATASAVPMLQSTGFCPLCDYRDLTTQPAGTANVSYASGANGHLQTAITLDAPLSGTWNIDQPIARLTGTPACTP